MPAPVRSMLSMRSVAGVAAAPDSRQQTAGTRMLPRNPVCVADVGNVWVGLGAGRDQLVYATDLRTLDSCCVLRSREAVLKMLIAPDKGLWLSMTNSDIEYWDVEPVLQVPVRPWSSRAPCARV